MATYYVWNGAGGTNAGTSWTNAYTAFASAVTAANADGDIIKVHKTHQDELAADTTYTFTNSVQVICVDKDASDALAVMGTGGWIGKSATTSYAISIAGTAAKPLYVYGITLRNAAATNKAISILTTAADTSITLESCYFWLGTTSSTARVFLGPNNIAGGVIGLCVVNCTFRFGSTGQGISVNGAARFIGGSVSADGSLPSTFFMEGASPRIGIDVIVDGMDLSALGSSTLVGDHTNTTAVYRFENCKLGASFVALATQSAYGQAVEAYLYNCDSGDVHYAFGHYNALGSCVAYTAIYANDGPTYDGTNEFSWRIDTSAKASYGLPYVSPWTSTYHSGTSAITPRLEILRDGSATAYYDDEVWGEFSYQGTSGYPLATLVNDRMAPLGTRAAQASSSLGSGDWTGEGGTAWFGKLTPASTITPAEIGELKARVYVAVASSTVYIDPQIRAA